MRENMVLMLIELMVIATVMGILMMERTMKILAMMMMMIKWRVVMRRDHSCLLAFSC